MPIDFSLVECWSWFFEEDRADFVSTTMSDTENNDHLEPGVQAQLRLLNEQHAQALTAQAQAHAAALAEAQQMAANAQAALLAQQQALPQPPANANPPLPVNNPLNQAGQVGAGSGNAVAGAANAAAAAAAAGRPPMRTVKLEAFRPDLPGNPWVAYKIKMRSAFSRAYVYNDRDKKDAFFEVLSLDLIEWLTNHFHPLDIESNEVSFQTLITACDSRFRVQESKRYAAFMFGNRIFAQGLETVDDWIIDLERLASRSNFGDYLESAIINQLIRGIGDISLQVDISSDDTLTKDQVIARIRHWDQTIREASSMSGPHHKAHRPSPVFSVTPSPAGSPTDRVAVSDASAAEGGVGVKPVSVATVAWQASSAVSQNAGNGLATLPKEARALPSAGRSLRCNSCGGDHERDSCRFRTSVCFKCQKVGHVVSVCRSTDSIPAAPSNFRPKRTDKRGQGTGGGGYGSPVVTQGPMLPASNSVASNPQTPGNGPNNSTSTHSAPHNGVNQLSYLFPILCVKDKWQFSPEVTKPLTVTVTVDSQSIDFIADTGSAQSLIGEELFHKLWPQRVCSLSPGKMAMWDGSPIHILGYCPVTVSLENRTFQGALYVCAGNGPAILGRVWLNALGFKLTQCLGEVATI